MIQDKTHLVYKIIMYVLTKWYSMQKVYAKVYQRLSKHENHEVNTLYQLPWFLATEVIIQYEWFRKKYHIIPTYLHYISKEYK